MEIIKNHLNTRNRQYFGFVVSGITHTYFISFIIPVGKLAAATTGQPGIVIACFDVCGRNWSTRRKLTQAQGEHANSPQKRTGVDLWTFLL